MTWMEQLQAENARLRGGRQASNQRIAELEAEAAVANPMAEKAHTFCSAWLQLPSDMGGVLAALNDLIDVHKAQTPSPEVPS